MGMRPTYPNLGSTYARLAWPTHPSRKAKNSGFNNLTSLFMDVIQALRNLSDFVSILINSRLVTKPMVSFCLLYK